MNSSAFDIIVIGAGIAGTGVAAMLPKNLRVLILEQESQPGYHSTGRSAALFAPTYGADQIRALTRASEDFFRTPPQGFAEAPLLQPRGVLAIADASQHAGIQRWLTTPDIAAVIQEKTIAEAARLCPLLRQDRITHCLYDPTAHDIEVHALHQGFLRMARAQGAAVRTDSTVTAIERKAGNWIVSTKDETFQAAVVVNAAGAWASEVAALAGLKNIELTPKRRTAVLVAGPQAMDISAMPMVLDIDEHFYCKPDSGRLLLSPADETASQPCDAQPEELDIAIAIDRVQSAITLDIRSVSHSWAGLRTFAADRLPVVGFDHRAEGFFWLAGQGGYGIQTAPALSELAARLICDESASSNILDEGVDPAKLNPARLIP